MLKLIFSGKGVLTRRELLCFVLPCEIVMFVLFRLLFQFVVNHGTDVHTSKLLLFFLSLLAGLVGLTCMYVTICMILKRLRDEGLSCWFLVPALVLDWWVLPYSWLPLCLLKSKESRVGTSSEKDEP